MVGQIVRRGGPAARFRASLTLKMGIRPTSAFAGTALTAGRVRSWPGGVAPGGPSGRGLDRDGSLPARTLAEGAPRCPIPYPRWQPRSRSTRPSGLITKLLGTLRAQPDLAALKLAAALDEIVDTYRVVDEAFTASASLAPDHDGLTSSSQQPLAIAGGSLSVRVSEGRDHCHKIGFIYWQHLTRWFERALNPSERSQIEAVFLRLGEVDDDLFLALTGLADRLEGDAGEVLEDVIEGRHDQARRQVLETYRTLAPVQQAMAQGMHTFALKDEFAGLARVA